MQDKLIKYINSFATTPLTGDEEELVKKYFAPKKIRKHQYFLQEGEVCKYYAFIVKGAMRQYTIDEKGAEHISRLSIENWWVGDRESYVKLTPSPYNVDAWEDTDVLSITKVNFINLRDDVAAIGEMLRKLDENHAFANQKRLNASISMCAEKRYADFEKTYPEFLQRFPQHILASYLGMTKETLCRIHKQIEAKIVLPLQHSFLHA